MKILITGSGGFIGSNLMKALKKEGKHEILGVDKKFGTDISNFTSMAQQVLRFLKKPDLIVHLAAQTSTKKSVEFPAKDFQDNVMGTFNICELAKITGASVIYASSRKVLHAPYGVSKYVGELYLQEYEKTFGIKTLITRFGNVYGPGQQGSQEGFWLAWFIKASIEKQPITIYGWDGKQSRDMLFVNDCVNLLMDQINHFQKYRAVAKGEVLTCGGGPENEINLLDALKFINYENFKISPDKLAGDVMREVTDNTHITAINNWRPVVPIEEGIRLTLESCRKEAHK